MFLSTGASGSSGRGWGPRVCISTESPVVLTTRDHTLRTTASQYPRKQVPLLFPFYKRGNRGTERNMPRATQSRSQDWGSQAQPGPSAPCLSPGPVSPALALRTRCLHMDWAGMGTAVTAAWHFLCTGDCTWASPLPAPSVPTAAARGRETEAPGSGATCPGSHGCSIQTLTL